MIPVRYVQYGFGRHRIYYVTEGGGDSPEFSSLTVHCYFPDKNNKLIIKLKHLDPGIYYFEIFFRHLGNHLFVFFEDEQKTGILNAIVKDRMY